MTFNLLNFDRLPFSPQERDIDLLLLKELSCSPQFTAQLAAHADIPGAILLDVRHSVSTALGETDVLATFEWGGQKVALLIEDKIGAAMQPKQASRYRERGKQLVDEGKASHFKTLLIAPETYLGGVPREDWDLVASFELVSNWVGDEDDKRSVWQRKLLQYAAQKVRRAYAAETVSRLTPEQIAAIKTFKKHYAENVNARFPAFRINSTESLEAGYVFKAKGAPSHISFWHLITRGELNLCFENRWKNRAIEALTGQIDEARMRVHPGSVHVTASVEAMDMTATLAEQIDILEATMSIAEAGLPLISLVIDSASDNAP